MRLAPINVAVLPEVEDHHELNLVSYAYHLSVYCMHTLLVFTHSLST